MCEILVVHGTLGWHGTVCGLMLSARMPRAHLWTTEAEQYRSVKGCPLQRETRVTE
jgi:hypothetical protein